MNYPGRTLAATVVLLSAASSCLAQTKYTLAYHAKPGQICRYKSSIALKVSAGANTLAIQMGQTSRVTFRTVAANGDITMLNKTEDGFIEVNGSKQPMPEDEKTTDTYTIHPDGTLVSFKPGSPDKSNLSVRLFVATTPTFPTTPLSVGSTWTHDIAADSALGTRAGHAEYKLVSVGTTEGAKTADVHMHYTESGGLHPLTIDGDINVELSSGDSVSGVLKLDNLPFGGGNALATGTLNENRTEGSPLGDVKTGGVADASATPKPKTIADEVKGFTKIPGLFTLYRKKAGTTDTIYMQISDDQLDKPFLMEVTARTGDTQHITPGTPISDLVFKFEKAPDGRIMLVVPNYNFRATAGTPIDRAVKRSFADARLEIFTVKAKQDKPGEVLIDVSDLFRGDISEVTDAFKTAGSILGGGGAYSLDRDKTFVTKVAAFPKNDLIETSYNFAHLGASPAGSMFATTMLADDRSVPITVDYLIFSVAPDGYMPRIYDPRVGYFTTSFQDFDNDNLRNQKVQYIYRWNIKKKDPKAAVSEPVKPIVFWIDNAIPVQYRPAVRKAILEWNRAFLAIGIKDAIVVHQMPADAHWDQADMRHNVVRWVVSPSSGYAVSLMRINPITGEIVNADITVDANIVRLTKVDAQIQVAPASYFNMLEQPVTPASLRAMESPFGCTFAQEGQMNAWEGDLALDMLGGATNRNLLVHYGENYLQEVVSHEMGHILGLRHNFLASTYHTLNQLAHLTHGAGSDISASVMDYPPFNIEALKHPGVPLWQHTVGVYDMWAIKYGYMPINASTPTGELYQLHQVASESNAPGHPYQSDEIADQFDPNVTRFDLGKDPILYWTKMMNLSRFLMLTLYHRTPKDGRSYSRFTQDFYGLLGNYSRAASEVARYIGGLHVNRNYRGDAGEKPTLVPVSAAQQQNALSLLNRYIFSSKALTFPRDYYTHFTVDQNAGFRVMLQRQDYPIFNTVSNLQASALKYLFSASTLDRVANNEYKVGDTHGAFTMAQLFHDVTANVWDDVLTGQNVGALHRSLQQVYVGVMADIVLGKASVQPDAQMLAWYQLHSLQHVIAADMQKPHDTYTKIHLQEISMEINRILQAHISIGSGGSSSGSSLLQLLLGGQKPE